MSLNFINHYGASYDSPFQLQELPESSFEKACKNMQAVSQAYAHLSQLIDHVLKVKRRPSTDASANLVGEAQRVFSLLSRASVRSPFDCNPLLDAIDQVIAVWKNGTGAGRTHLPSYRLTPEFKKALSGLEYQTRSLAAQYARLRDDWHKHHQTSQVYVSHSNMALT